MKNTFIFTLTILIFFSCNKDKRQSVEDRINPNDIECHKELTEAKNDIKKGKLVYCHYTGNIMFQKLRAEKQMDSLLKKFNIEYRNESSPCVQEEEKNYHCYCEYMEEKITNMFGDKFIDSLLYIADDIYISKKLDHIYEYREYDKCALFPGDTKYDDSNHDGLQSQFEKVVKYPKNYRFTKCQEGCWATMIVDIEIDEFGNAKVKNNRFDYFNSDTKEENYNLEFNNYFETIVKSLIENTKWIPAKIKSHNVKSKNEIYIYLK